MRAPARTHICTIAWPQSARASGALRAGHRRLFAAPTRGGTDFRRALRRTPGPAPHDTRLRPCYRRRAGAQARQARKPAEGHTLQMAAGLHANMGAPPQLSSLMTLANLGSNLGNFCQEREPEVLLKSQGAGATMGSAAPLLAQRSVRGTRVRGAALTGLAVCVCASLLAASTLLVDHRPAVAADELMPAQLDAALGEPIEGLPLSLSPRAVRQGHSTMLASLAGDSDSGASSSVLGARQDQVAEDAALEGTDTQDSDERRQQEKRGLEEDEERAESSATGNDEDAEGSPRDDVEEDTDADAEEGAGVEGAAGAQADDDDGYVHDIDLPRWGGRCIPASLQRDAAHTRDSDSNMRVP